MTAIRFVLVVNEGPGPMENVSVFGPWRSREKAETAGARLNSALPDDDGANYQALWVVEALKPEFGSAWSLSALLRRLRGESDG